MYDLTTLGELLVDFVCTNSSNSGSRLFEQNAGGAPANVACVVSKLGLKTSFIGKVGNDLHGNYLKEVLKEQKVNTSGVVFDKNFFTTLAFVQLEDNGERNFSFSRNPGADTNLEKSEIDINLIKKSKIFHFGSLSLTNEPSRSSTLYAIREAKNAGVLISYDPNYRDNTWKSEEEALKMMRSVLKDVDIIKISEEELEIITKKSDINSAINYLLNLGISCVVLTLGSKGSLIATKKFIEKVEAFKTTAIDTTGAGDSFWGAFLYKLLINNKNPQYLTKEEGIDFLKFSNAVASLCVEKRGAIPAIPDFNSIKKRLDSKK
ncbi:MAG: carbohydrate kinase family protein [Cetobacterium sp.]